MVCCQEIREDHEFQLWKNFPKGLRVLLLCNDADSSSQTQTKLEQMEYIVSWYDNFDEGQKAISEKSELFHVAILEVTTDNCQHSFKFLEKARDLPVIVISSDSSLSTMMKCIALGAAEFLQKPLSEDKLRNIWQHVIHKAFNSRGECNNTLSTLNPIKEMVVSLLHLSQEEKAERSEHEIHEKLTSPSTPQLESKLRLSSNNIEESEERNNKSADKNCNDLVVAPSKNDNEEVKELTKHEEEVNSIEISKSDACSSAKEGHGNVRLTGSKMKKNGSSSQATKDNKKKSKVDWTPDLHKRFVKAVEQLGIDQAIPSKILDLMKVEGLTRHNIASHLQKYRMHRRHILPKKEESWKTPQDTCARSYMQRPILAPYPPFQQYYPVPPFAPWYHHHQSYYYRPFQPWHVPAVQETWPWKSHPPVHADTWGCPVFPPYAHNHNVPSPMPPPTCNKYGTEDGSNYFSLDEEVIDKVVKEAMAEPWAPLPLGLTPPSTESVLSELHRLGIHTVPVLPTAPLSNHTPRDY
ncbi:Two-component response regulator-like protein [Rhynchospora pubera]|uniref:Two-component response regulator-like protein n=1 Tax=Rhynchospora pubera TaxID=906938 RepID=A0AAV8AUG3_9POAL|nr:Two-component response regulator-like protein [Rhynchospora pubera]